MSHVYAQTNIQLYEQLRCDGFKQADLVHVHKAYSYAIKLFDGQYRASGKPFLNHLVGTASILATLSEPPQVICAGLLHAAYSHGSFGFIALGGLSLRRRQLRDTVGKEVEKLVNDYSNLSWGIDDLRQACGELEAASTWERMILSLRVSNEVEDHLDRGMAYSDKHREAGGSSERLLLLRELTAGLGHGSLADALPALMCAGREAPITYDLRSQYSRSFYVRPNFWHALNHTARKFKRRRN